jgi:uncharacterized RDD family membrane protein YckC
MFAIMGVYVDNTDERPSRFFYGLVVFFVIFNSCVIILHGFVRIPTAVLSAFQGAASK